VRAWWEAALVLLTLALTAYSFICFPETWEGIWALCVFNFVVIAPLCATTALLCCKGRFRIVLAIVAFIVPASVISMMKPPVLAARESQSPRRITVKTMRFTLDRIKDYMSEHGQVPGALSELPEIKGRYGKAIDGWGHDLQYSVDGKGAITLTSLGADGKPGGEGDDSDVVLHYRARTPDGKLDTDGDYSINNANVDEPSRNH
jgi:general secretion pathway protein G